MLFALPLFAADRITVGSLSKVSAHAGDSVTVTIPLQVARGYHVNSNPAASDFYIPLEVIFSDTFFAQVGEPQYPKGRKWRLKGGDEKLLVYSGRVKIIVPLTIPEDALLGVFELRGSIEYQACDDEVCFMPESQSVSIRLRVIC